MKKVIIKSIEIANPDYYLTHFEQVLNHVLHRDSHLLSKGELDLLAAYKQSKVISRRLFARLTCRVDNWQRTSKVNYIEIPEKEKYIEELCQIGWLRSWNGERKFLPGILDTLNKKEISSFLNLSGKGVNAPVSTLKMILLEELSKEDSFQLYDLWHQGDESAELSVDKILKDFDGWILLEHRRLIRTIFLLFFANRHQSLSDFVLENLGHRRYENYPVQSAGVFSTRRELDEILHLGDLREEIPLICHESLKELRKSRHDKEIDISEDNLKIISGLIQTGRELISEFESASIKSEICASILLNICSLLERARMYETAIEFLSKLLNCSISSELRAKVIRRILPDLKHIGENTRRKEIVRIELENNPDPVLQYFLQKNIRAVTKSNKTESLFNQETIKAEKLKLHHKSKSLFYNKSDKLVYVEDLALGHFENAGWNGLHIENSLFRTLLGLVFWDIVFCESNKAFIHPFQTAPLDWGKHSFYMNRKASIDMRLEEVRKGESTKLALNTIECKTGIANPLINWEKLDIDSITAALDGIKAEQLAAIFDRLIQNYRVIGRGMPDLFIWKKKPGNSETTTVAFVEVKGPGDTLSEAQELWLNFLYQIGLDCRVLHIKECEKIENLNQSL
jgi:hypothetical protein